MTWNIDRVRDAFPALSLADEGVPRAYLDAPAGTQVAGARHRPHAPGDGRGLRQRRRRLPHLDRGRRRGHGSPQGGGRVPRRGVVGGDRLRPEHHQLAVQLLAHAVAVVAGGRRDRAHPHGPRRQCRALADRGGGARRHRALAGVRPGELPLPLRRPRRADRAAHPAGRLQPRQQHHRHGQRRGRDRPRRQVGRRGHRGRRGAVGPSHADRRPGAGLRPLRLLALQVLRAARGRALRAARDPGGHGAAEGAAFARRDALALCAGHAVLRGPGRGDRRHRAHRLAGDLAAAARPRTRRCASACAPAGRRPRRTSGR